MKRVLIHEARNRVSVIMTQIGDLDRLEERLVERSGIAGRKIGKKQAGE